MIRETRRLFLLLFCFLIHSVDAWSQEHGADLVQQGQYIFSLAGGCACHTVPKGTFNAGARAFPIPLGKFTARILPKTKKRGSAVGPTNRSTTPSLREFDVTATTLSP